MIRCNYGERQWEIGYLGIQDRYAASTGKVTVLHDCTRRARSCNITFQTKYIEFLKSIPVGRIKLGQYVHKVEQKQDIVSVQTDHKSYKVIQC